MASLGARQRWKERKEIQVEERGREARERKVEQAGKEPGRHLRGVGGGMATPGWQCRIKRTPGPAEIDASRGSSLIYAFITVNNASPFASGLSLSLSLSLSLVRSSLDAIPSRLPDPREVGFIIRHWCTRPFHRVTISARGEAFFKNYLSRFLRAIFMTVWVSLDTFFSFLL